jgi:maltose alpha-D-glucosyltransferase/alpha-amylase
MVHWIMDLLRLRSEHAALRSNAGFSPVAAPGDGRLFAYGRDSRNGDEHLLVALNPGLDEESFELPGHAEAPRALLSEGTVDVGSGRVRMGAQSFAVIAL